LTPRTYNTTHFCCCYCTSISDLFYILQSTAKLEDVVKDSQLPASRVSKMICLPSIARHEGVCLHCCPTPDDSLTKLFQACGGVVSLQTESELEAAMMTSCMMGPLFGIMKEGRDWLLRHTSLPPQEASYLIIQQYIGAVQLAERGSESDPNRLDDLIAEQTTGGLNAQALDNLDKAGGLEAQRKVMDAILSRIRGDSDGSVPSK
jgi:pyrroline-5-carboxylate reductase